MGFLKDGNGNPKDKNTSINLIFVTWEKKISNIKKLVHFVPNISEMAIGSGFLKAGNGYLKLGNTFNNLNFIN